MKKLKILLIFLVSLTMNTIVTAKTSVKQFNEAMHLANSLRNTIRSDGDTIKVIKSTGEAVTFDPQTVFKDQPGGYSSNPPQVSYGTDVNAMQNAANLKITQDTANKDIYDNQAVGKMVADNFKTRPIFEISKDDDFMVKSNAVISSAQNIGQSSNEVDCDSQQSTQEKCVTTFEPKSCDEEIRSVTRICEQIPKVMIVTEDVVHANCRHLDIRYGHRNRCQAGYRGLLYSDVLNGPTWDDVFLCDRPAQEGEHECYVGYAVYGRHHKNNWRNDYENVWAQGIVPKKMQGYVRIERTYEGNMSGTIVNQTKGEIVAKGSWSENQIIQLPVSETQDQVFRYEHHAGKGIVKIYVGRINRVKEAQVTWEESCRDI